ncbi:MAG: hypothetical protein HQ522_03390, partial [Bacteroidetes bacterium]|nr:hypothetical protein [Bacteroidota bacterium]
MKTKNNVQKAILKSLVVLTSLVLISITVNAQDFWKSLLADNRFNGIELAVLDNRAETRMKTMDDYTFAESLEEESEETLELEDWMLNENNFEILISIEEEIENKLELEDWMTNDDLFNTNSIYLEVETEEALELENWMTDEALFNK